MKRGRHRFSALLYIIIVSTRSPLNMLMAVSVFGILPSDFRQSIFRMVLTFNGIFKVEAIFLYDESKSSVSSHCFMWVWRLQKPALDGFSDHP